MSCKGKAVETERRWPEHGHMWPARLLHSNRIRGDLFPGFLSSGAIHVYSALLRWANKSPLCKDHGSLISRPVSELVGLVPFLSQPDSEREVASRGLERLIPQTHCYE